MSEHTPSSSHTVSAELLQRYDKPGPRYTSYPTAVEFHSDFDETAYRQALKAAALINAPLSIYTHLPFCQERCLYCACNVVITPHQQVAEPYLERLKREIELVQDLLGERRKVSQFHFGGGTPTYYRPEQLAELMQFYRQHFDFLPDAEIALEVDPRVTTSEHLEVLAAQGFNRLSLGVQDFDPLVQETVHRIQSVTDARALIDYARALGFGSINVDLIYGLPHQSNTSFSRTIKQVIALKPDRLAVYSFALVPWMKQHQKLLPQDALPKGLAKFELLAIARELLLQAGYQDIGMDHFALPGDELSIAQRQGRLWRNFMGYTTAKAPDMIGLGLSAIGSVAGSFSQNVKKLSQYYQALDEGRLPIERGYALNKDDLLRQHVIRELMCNFVIDKAEVEQRFAVDFDEYFALELSELKPLEAEGFVRLEDKAILAVDLGRLFVRNIAMVFDAYLRAKKQERPAFSRTV